MKDALNTVLHESVVRSAADVKHQNEQVTFKSDVHDSLIKVDTGHGFGFANVHDVDASREPREVLSIRTRTNTLSGKLYHGIFSRPRIRK